MITNCPYCGESLESISPAKKANHIRWCDLNPKRLSYLETLSKVRRTEYTEDRKQRMALGVHKAWSQGKYSEMVASKKGKSPHPQSQVSRDKISAAQRSLSYRRLMRYTREYVCKDGTKVLLDSSWEEILAKRLDSLNIKWIRPSYIPWVDLAGKSRKYFPDFYLPDYDIYLDPKNPAVEASQQNKLQIIYQILPNLVILRSQQECETYSPAPVLVP